MSASGRGRVPATWERETLKKTRMNIDITLTGEYGLG